MIAQFALQSPAMPVWMLILPLFILGMAMSTQFTSMNTITLADLTDENASSGNSVLAVTQQLSISLGLPSAPPFCVSMKVWKEPIRSSSSTTPL